MIQFLRGSQSALTTNNPVIGQGQPVFELDTRQLKIGDGTSNYSDLPYLISSGTSDLISGTSPLPTGCIYLVYE